MELDDVLQTCRIAAMQEVPKFNGGGNIQQFVAGKMQQRIIDLQRKETPGGRSKQKPLIVPEDDAKDLSAPDNVLALVAARQAIEALSGAEKRAAAKHLPKPDRKTSPNFDPASVRLHIGAPVPPVHRKRVNRFRQMVDLMPATGHVELDPDVAASLVSEFKKAKIRHCFRTLDSGLVGVWREPSAAQLEGLKKCQ
jgi:hypothetical protein